MRLECHALLGAFEKKLDMKFAIDQRVGMRGPVETANPIYNGWGPLSLVSCPADLRRNESAEV